MNLSTQAQNNPQVVLDDQTTRQVLNPITQNIILQIPPTDKQLTIMLNLKFEN
ncbi:5935_t:CDS:2 [Dentiscutata heterogama]|uniref:5935_t:CDS:1 n=1 Tax=Dentiscutata heterogama TaxID=1316150 RepID=A0ACA9KHM0_9GLOM|nr:5935_t:CDS:2 [Dentiscutata heterogama]